MSLTWHIIKKDLRLMRWALLVWSAAGGFSWWAMRYAALRAAEVGGPTGLPGPLSAIAFVVLSIVMLARLVQEDSPVDANVDWRSRPISGGRLLAAKAMVLLGLFVVLPSLRLFGPRMPWISADWVSTLREVTAILAAVLFLATLAATSRTLTVFFLLIFGCYLVFGSMSVWQNETVRAERALSRAILQDWSTLRTWIGCGWVILASAVALNAYYRQRRWVLGVSAMVAAVAGFCAVQIFVRPPLPQGTSASARPVYR